MINIRKAAERGHADHGWLQTYHTFSFAGYQDPGHMGFRSLRVMNEDRVAAGQGFGTHAHRDMEIVSYVLDGALEHKDSMGNGEVLRPGEFQRISAGTGITHSEFNPSEHDPTHFYQIWLFPERTGLDPSYEQKAFDPADRRNRFQLVASPDSEQGSLSIHQDAKIWLADLDPTETVAYDVASGRHLWLQVLSGEVASGGERLGASDGAAISDVTRWEVTGVSPAQIMLFDLA